MFCSMHSSSYACWFATHAVCMLAIELLMEMLMSAEKRLASATD